MGGTEGGESAVRMYWKQTENSLWQTKLLDPSGTPKVPSQENGKTQMTPIDCGNTITSGLRNASFLTRALPKPWTSRVLENWLPLFALIRYASLWSPSSTTTSPRSSGSGSWRLTAYVAVGDLILSYVPAGDHWPLPSNTLGRNLGWPSRKISVISTDSETIWIILPSQIYPSHISDNLDGYCSFIILITASTQVLSQWLQLSCQSISCVKVRP